MWSIARAMSNASAKLVATFFMVIFLMLIGLVLFPHQLNQLNDFANWIANWEAIRNPDIPEQGKFLFRTLVNESTIFGILTTLIARIFVEVIWWGSVRLWAMVNPPEEAPAPKAEGEAGSSYY